MHRPKRLDGSYAMMVAGPGVPAGGLEGQFLRKISDADYDTGWFRVGFINLAGIPSDNDALQEVLANKASINHIHDDRYYSEAEVDTLLAQLLVTIASLYAPIDHVHLLVPGEISGTTYEVTAADEYSAWLCTNAALTTISLGNAAPIGARVRFKAMGAGGFVYEAADGMVLDSAEDFFTTPQFGVSEAWRISATDWSIVGHVEE